MNEYDQDTPLTFEVTDIHTCAVEFEGLCVHRQLHQAQRGHDFYPPKSENLPALLSTENTPVMKRIVIAHYFGPSQDWWLFELDPRTGIGYGVTNFGNPDNDDWGDIWLPEIEAAQLNAVINGQIFRGALVFERDCYWRPRPVSEIPSLMKFHRSWWDEG